MTSSGLPGGVIARIPQWGALLGPAGTCWTSLNSTLTDLVIAESLFRLSRAPHYRSALTVRPQVQTKTDGTGCIALLCVCMDTGH